MKNATTFGYSYDHLEILSEPSVRELYVDRLILKCWRQFSKNKVIMKKYPKSWGHYSNGSWGGILGAAASKEVDVSLDYLTITQERLNDVDFSLPFIFFRLTFLTNVTAEAPGVEAFVNVFTWKVWMLVLFSVLLCSTTLEFIDNVQGRTTPFLKRFLERCVLLCGNFLLKDDPRPMRSDPGRLLLALWWWFVITLTCTYTGALLANLAVPKPSVVIDTAQDLLTAIRHKGFYILVHEGSDQTSFFDEFPPSERRTFRSAFRYFDNSRSDEENLRLCLLDNRCVSFRFDATGGQLNGVDCGLHLAKGISLLGFGALAFPKGSLYREIFDRLIARVLETGLKELAERNEFWSECRGCLASKSVPPVPDLCSDGQMTFRMLPAAFGLSVLVLIAERALYTSRKRKINKN